MKIRLRRGGLALDVRPFVPFMTLCNFFKIELFVTCGEESQILELSQGEVIDLLIGHNSPALLW